MKYPKISIDDTWTYMGRPVKILKITQRIISAITYDEEGPLIGDYTRTQWWSAFNRGFLKLEKKGT